ncbi:MAG: GHKL domain-containing protein [Lachnospiraceae bacterium]|nr:GHKL domain-containing protein [Lachnospiraceae bacterium]
MIKPVFLLMRWLQTIPIALLMLTPFSDLELRRERRRCLLCSVIYLIFGCAALALLSAAVSTGGQRNIVARDISLAAVLAVYLSGWASVLRVPTVRKLLIGGMMLHYAAMLNAMSNVFAAFVLGENYVANVNAESGSMILCLCLLASTVLTWPLVWYFLRRVLRESLPVLEEREARRGLVYLCIMFVLFCLATYNPHYESMPDTPLFVTALVVTNMAAYFIFFREIGTVRKQAETARELAVWQTQYQHLIRRMEEARRLRHDLRHHLNTLGALNAQGRQEEIADYLKQYGTVYDRLEEQKFSGDPVVDSVLEYYLAQAGEEGIPVKCRVSLEGGGSGVDAMDMTVLLGNCLENALEALRPLPAEARRLSVEIAPMGVMLLVRIVNTCGNLEDGRDFAGWEAFPSCKGKGRKGVGLRSVAAIAEKYGGSAQFQRKNEEFTARISLCMCW